MNYGTLLQGIISSESEKTAGDNTQQQPEVKSAADVAKESLEATLKQAVQNEKNASAKPSDPVEALIKEAQRLAEDEKTAELIHIRNCGRAFADAAGEAWASQTNKVAQVQQPVTPEDDTMLKQAAEQQGYIDTMTKVAAEQGYIDVMQKVAAEQGYADTMQKVAAEQYKEGQASALEDMRNAAAQEFLKGAQEVEVLISQNNVR